MKKASANAAEAFSKLFTIDIQKFRTRKNKRASAKKTWRMLFF
jgi:hypothetical protein